MSGAEFSFIDAWRARLARDLPANRRLVVPPGDDTALVPTAGGAVLFAADMLMDGVHFDLRTTTPRLVGRKALAVNLSDVAAMAGTPTAIVVSLALPQGADGAGVVLGDELMSGLVELAAAFDVAVAGGDTNSWRGPLVVNVAVLGDPHARGSVERRGAAPGDVLVVTGPLGGSIHGRHLRFDPRVREAALLHARYGIKAMIDLSDGLASDLRHLLAASGCGATLDAAAIPVHPDVVAHPDERSPLDHALSDGEDFELCLALAPAAAMRLLAERPFGAALAPCVIGEVTAAAGLRWRDGSVVVQRGFVHRL